MNPAPGLLVCDEHGVHFVSYADVFPTPAGDQGKLQAWRRQGASLFCTCHPDGLIRMALRNHPVHKQDMQVLYKLDRALDHEPTCPRYAADAPQETDRVVHEPAARFVTAADGTRVLLVHAADLFAPDDPQPEKPTSDVPDGGEGAVRDYALKKARPSGRLTAKRATVAFGGLIREWYELGIENACVYYHRPPQGERELLKSMRKVLLEGKIALDDERPLKQMAFVPFAKLDPNRLFRPVILVGGLTASRPDRVAGQSDLWRVAGSDEGWWVVEVKAEHVPREDVTGWFVALG